MVKLNVPAEVLSSLLFADKAVLLSLLFADKAVTTKIIDASFDQQQNMVVLDIVGLDLADADKE